MKEMKKAFSDRVEHVLKNGKESSKIGRVKIHVASGLAGEVGKCQVIKGQVWSA